MDIRLYGSLSISSKLDQPEPPKDTSSSSESYSECLDPTCKLSPPKKPHTTLHKWPKSHSLTSKRKYNTKWEEKFSWLEHSEDHQGAFCKVCKNEEECFKELEEHGVLSHSITGRRKMRAHAWSDIHIH